MKPVKPLDANMIYKGPTSEIGDLECTRIKAGHIKSEWRLSQDEVEYLYAGGLIKMEILTEPIPPIAINVTEPYCPECMLEMTLEWKDERSGKDTQPMVMAHWHFRCSQCRRWA